METVPERFFVAQLLFISTVMEALNNAELPHEQVQYIKVSLTGHTVYFASQDLDFDKHPVGEAIKKLIQNYKAIA